MKKTLIIFLSIVTFPLVSFLLFIFIVTSGEGSTSPKAPIIHTSTSPNKEQTLFIHLYEPNPGDIGVTPSIEGILVSGEKRKKIYFEDGVNNVKVKWINNTAVIINGNKLKITKSIYH